MTRQLEEELLEEATDKTCSNIIAGMNGAMITKGEGADFHLVKFLGGVREVENDEDDPSMMVPTTGPRGSERPLIHHKGDKVDSEGSPGSSPCCCLPLAALAARLRRLILPKSLRSDSSPS